MLSLTTFLWLKDNERRHIELHRLYTTFPEGLPGLGLLLLRVATAGTLIFLTVHFFTETIDISVPGWLIWTTVFVFSAALLVGFLTPVFGTILAIGGILLLVLPLAPISTAFAVYLTVLSVLIALLGPGAYSVDAHIFGLREIVISKKN